jgi:FMN phosphatase YigB (HAD superfamily)
LGDRAVIRAVLFDLDGTLLHIDTARFIEVYTRLLAAWFARWIPPEAFVAHLLAATWKMTENRDPKRTNKEVFDEAFYPAVGMSAEIMAPHLADFYEREFPKLREMAAPPDPAAREAVSVVLAQGLTAVLATHPILPAVATRARMEWAGIADFPFALVTSYETSHFCKPHPEYFQEVAASIRCDLRDCLFVGNDVIEDTAARQLGMQTYLVTDHLTNRSRLQAGAGPTGTLKELPGFLASFLMRATE